MRVIYFLGLICLGALTQSANLFAGQIVKNGGAIVNGTCYRNQVGEPVEATELLDFYEAIVLRNWTLALGDPQLSVGEKVEIMLSRLAVVDPVRATAIRTWYRNFEAERGWLSNGAELPTVDDVGEIRSVLPQRCFIYQAAGQRIPDNPPFDPYYIFNSAWWTRLNNDSKAGLIVHELIYRDGVQRGHRDSVGTRFLTALLATDRIDQGSIAPDIYQGILFRNKFDSFTYNDFRLYTENLVTSDAEAQDFCLSLAPNSQLPQYYGTRELKADDQYLTHHVFKESALGRLLFSWPEEKRVFRVAGAVIKLTTTAFVNADEFQGLPAAPLCFIRL